MSVKKYPAGAFVYYRDNLGDMIIGEVIVRSSDRMFLTVNRRWYAPEPAVLLPLRRITGDQKLNRIPVSIIEKVELHAPE